MMIKIAQLANIHTKRNIWYSDSWNNIQINNLSIKILNEPTIVFDRDKKEDRLFCLTRYFSSNGFWWSFLLAIYYLLKFAKVMIKFPFYKKCPINYTTISFGYSNNFWHLRLQFCCVRNCLKLWDTTLIYNYRFFEWNWKLTINV